MRTSGRRTQAGGESVCPGAATGGAEGTERVAGTDFWKAKEGTVEPRQEVVSVNQGTDTENSGCHTHIEASLDED